MSLRKPKDEETRRAERAMLSIRKDDPWELVVDEETGREVYRHRGRKPYNSHEELMENLRALQDLVDWDALAESVAKSRAADLQYEQRLDEQRAEPIE